MLAEWFAGSPPLQRGAAQRGHEKVDCGHRWGSAKVERGHRKKVGGTTLLAIQNAHR